MNVLNVIFLRYCYHACPTSEMDPFQQQREKTLEIQHDVRFLMFFFKVFGNSYCHLSVKEEECIFEHLESITELFNHTDLKIRKWLNNKLDKISEKLILFDIIGKSDKIRDLVQSNESIFRIKNNEINEKLIHSKILAV
jgi:hypothetical protein